MIPNGVREISAPETHLDKTYHVQIGAIRDESLLEALHNGVRSSKTGVLLRAKRASVLRRGERNFVDRNCFGRRQEPADRRMLEHFQIEVLQLVRVAIGPLTLCDLAKAKNARDPGRREAGSGPRDARGQPRACLFSSLTSLFCFVREAHFGFFVENQRPEEVIRVAGSWHIDANRQHAGDALL